VPFDRERFVKSQAGTVVVALVMCLVCAALVSVSAVALRPRIQANRELKLKRNVLAAAGRFEPGMSEKQIAQQFDAITTVMVALPRAKHTGAEPGEPAAGLPENYDPRKASKDSKLSIEIPPELDLAKIKRREIAAPVYLVQEGGRTKQYIFPIYGKGLWSTMFGFIALAEDLRTVEGISFYEHAETPGLGGEIDNDRWKAGWEGKQAISPEGRPQIDVIKGSVDEGAPGAERRIDGLSGATITSVGVEGTVNYWLGPDAFGPFIDKQRR
jgi:Na+-transporting NADH:ubiquinone oxidoreductase subunit C